MLGIFFTLTGLFATIGSSIRECLSNEESRIWWGQKYHEGLNPAGVYYDNRGKCRDINTNRLMTTSRDRYTGDFIGEDLNGCYTVNYTHEYREKLFEYYFNNPDKREGRTVVIDKDIPRGTRPHSKNDYMDMCCWGQWYKDLTYDEVLDLGNGKTFRVIRWLVGRSGKYANWYMDCATAKYIRPTDEWLEENAGNIDEAKLNKEMEEHNAWVEDQGWVKDSYFKIGKDDMDYWLGKYCVKNAIPKSDRDLEEIKKMGPVLNPIHYAH